MYSKYVCVYVCVPTKVTNILFIYKWNTIVYYLYSNRMNIPLCLNDISKEWQRMAMQKMLLLRLTFVLVLFGLATNALSID